MANSCNRWGIETLATDASASLQALFSIIDHSLRRNPDQERVIGTLLGVRSEDGTEIEIRNCYAVPHTETAEQVEVDMDYQKTMLALHLRANPREVLVGWYATSAELNTFSALIQNFYGQQGDGTWPHPAVHLTVSTQPGREIEARTYISAPIGVTAERAADSCLFIPVPYAIKYSEADRSGLELIGAARNREDRTQGVITDIEALERAVEQVLDLLDRVSNYVNNVLDEEATPSSALGQFLLNALSLAPKVDPSDIERDLYVSPTLPYIPPLYEFPCMYNFFSCNAILTFCVPATTTSRTSSSSRTSPTPSARRSTCPTASPPPRSPSAPARARPPRAHPATASSKRAAATGTRSAASGSPEVVVVVVVVAVVEVEVRLRRRRRQWQRQRRRHEHEEIFRCDCKVLAVLSARRALLGTRVCGHECVRGHERL
jgi:proteasome lid subunit RPN8/RPN11